MYHFYNITVLLQDVVWFSKTKFDWMIAWEGAIALMFGYVIFKLARDKKKLHARNKELVSKIMDVRTSDLAGNDSVNAVANATADKEFEKRLKELEQKYEANVSETKKLWEKKETELRKLYMEEAEAELKKWKMMELEQWQMTELEQWKIKELDKVKRAAEDAHRKTELETLQHLRNLNRPK